LFETLRNLLRKKARTAITVFGIFIGIFAFTVMGALAEKINLMVGNGEQYFTGQITVNAALSGPSFVGGVFPVDKLAEIKGVRGVHAVSPEVMLLLEDKPTTTSLFGIPPMIYGTDLKGESWTQRKSRIRIKEGRLLRPGESGKVFLGYDLAREKRLKVGGRVIIKKHPFEVVGIAEKTMTGPDWMVLMSLEEARQLLIESQPYLRSLRDQASQFFGFSELMLAFLPPETRQQLDVLRQFSSGSLATSATVVWSSGENPEAVSRRIRAAVPEVEVFSPSQMRRSLRQATVLFNVIILGSALVALAVGSLSIINTMTMAVTERVREIGLKKALGARTSDIVGEFLAEAGYIGFSGGAIGVLVGWGFATLLNAYTAPRGGEIFLVTPRLALGAIGFSTVLGILSGIYPSLRAASLDCVRALREE
jgi:putative ABC transport system permease protein